MTVQNTDPLATRRLLDRRSCPEQLANIGDALVLAFLEQFAVPFEIRLAEDCPATSGRDLEGHKLVVEVENAEILNVVVDREALPTEVSPGPQGHVSLALRSHCCCGCCGG